MDVIWHRKKNAMLIMRSRKRHLMEEIELPKLRENQNDRRKRSLQILENIGSGHYQTSGDERKNLKSVSGERRNY